MSSADKTFQAALKEFKKRLTPKEEDEFQIATLEHVREEIARIQQEQENLKTMMNMARLQPFLEAMEQFGKIIEVFLNVSPFVAFIWGPMKLMLQVASTWTESFDILLGAYQQIGEHIPFLGQYAAIFEDHPHMQEILQLIYSDILEFHRRAIRYFTGRAWRKIFRSLWKDFESQFKNILDSLRRHKAMIKEQAVLLHLQQYQHDSHTTFLRVQQYQQETVEMIQRLKGWEESESQKIYIAVKDWIAGAHTQLDHDSFCSTRLDGPASGDWILKHEKVENWKEADRPVSSILWLNGIPGAGKTILASVIIDDCMRNKSFAMGYFYCKDGDPERNNCTSVFKGLLSQLISRCRDLVPYCYDKLLKSHETTLTSATLTRQLLELFCERIPRLYIIIDGLDECDHAQRKLILSVLTTMVDHCDSYQPGKLRVLFISQDYNDIKRSLPTAAVLSLGLKDNENDIKSYIEYWAVKVDVKHELASWHVDHIKSSTWANTRGNIKIIPLGARLNEFAGMFLFAKLVITNLYNQPTKKQLLEEIDVSRFPKGLGQAYERIMSRIERGATPEEWKIAQKLLGWMSCVKRPLKWPEIQGAVSIDVETERVDFDDRKLRVHVRDVCGSLIQVLPGDRLELVHNTAKEHIKRSDRVLGAKVECDLTALCLQYLTFECFDKNVDYEKLRHLALNGYFAFQDYAIAKWFHHFRDMLDAELKSSENDHRGESWQEVEKALGDFANCYEEDILLEPRVAASEEACKAFKACTFYEDLLSIWSHISRHEDKGSKARNDVSVEVLGKALRRNRQTIEELFSSTTASTSSERSLLVSFYGEKLYRCPKLTCFYFHEGFEDSKSRDNHVKRHDRPFICAVFDCPFAESGFTSNKDLEKHARNVHPETYDQSEMFAKAATVTAETTWRCHICEKSFTRGFILRNHLRSHSGDRPFSCPECGKAFTRANDCKRHQKLHNRR